MKRRGGAWVAASLLALVAGTVGAADRPLPPQVEQLARCRAIAADAERLACFDKAAAALAEAVDRKEVAIVDRQEVRSAKRSLFGIALPNLRLFSDQEDAEPVREINATVRSAQRDGRGHYLFTLSEGGTWQTIETARAEPEPGKPVTIRRAALGSYLARFDGARAVRVERLR